MRVTTVGDNGSATTVAQVLETRGEHLAQVIAARSHAGPTLPRITAEVTQADALAWALKQAGVTVVGEA